MDRYTCSLLQMSLADLGFVFKKSMKQNWAFYPFENKWMQYLSIKVIKLTVWKQNHNNQNTKCSQRWYKN